MSERNPRTRIVRQLRGGQITIPAEFRRLLGINDESLVQVTLADGELRIKPVRVAGVVAGSSWLKDLYDRFAPIREEAAALSGEEINAAIDQALAAVRKDDAQGRL
ncbi:MAG: AbrB/MazE/SpoVT family DNA-binding domain-containing protein [Chloroflexi bacterium]|nr:AbrB/MazE/SpoVT family DNA-binding domain-containing protein [Chloroflexota bacterium]